MTIVELHPDELFDKEILGVLTEAERARLDAHLRTCATCRFEREARADFLDEALTERQVANLAAVMSVAPTAANVRTRSTAPAPLPAAPVRRRRVGSRQIVLAAVAASFVASSAIAGWSRVRDREHRAPATMDASAPANATTAAKLKMHEAAPAPTTSATEEDPEATPPTIAPMLSATTEPRATPSPTHSVATTPKAQPEPMAVKTAPTVAVAPATRPEPSEMGPANPPPAPVVGAPELFAQAGRLRRAGSYDAALAVYRDLSAQFPNSSEATAGQAIVAQILLDRGDAPAALGHFDAYLSRGGTLGEEALAGRAIALQRLGRKREAAQAWAALLAEYPNSVHAARARSMLSSSGSP